MSHILDQLYETLQERKSADPETSYVAKLYKKGTKKIAQKVGEEATELVIEAMRLEEKPGKDKRRDEFIDEAADLLFHTLVLMSHHDVKPEEVFDVLAERVGISGLDEKASRKHN